MFVIIFNWNLTGIVQLRIYETLDYCNRSKLFLISVKVQFACNVRLLYNLNPETTLLGKQSYSIGCNVQ